MFIVASNPTFTAPVVANIPADGGKLTKAKFSVVFKALPKSEVDDLLKSIRDRTKAQIRAAKAEEKGEVIDEVQSLSDRDVLDQVLVGFGPDLLEEDRTPMAFTPANVDRLCSIFPVEHAIVKSFFENYITGPTKN